MSDINEWKEIFELYDKDGDQEITPKEANLAALAVGKDISSGVKSLKTVTYQMFISLLSGEILVEGEDFLTQKFRLFDHDNDGSITTTELKSLLKGIYSDFPDDKIEKMIHSADSTKSGKVTLQQFKEVMK